MQDVTFTIFDRTEHYPLVLDWWKANGWNHAPNPENLSSFGLVCCVDGMYAAAGWLYLTTSNMAWIEFLVVNPEVPLKKRAAALKCLLERLVEEAKGLKAEVVFSCLTSRGLISLYKKTGFHVGDKGATTMVLNICPSELQQPSASVEQSPQPVQ